MTRKYKKLLLDRYSTGVSSDWQAQTSTYTALKEKAGIDNLALEAWFQIIVRSFPLSFLTLKGDQLAKNVTTFKGMEKETRALYVAKLSTEPTPLRLKTNHTTFKRKLETSIQAGLDKSKRPRFSQPEASPLVISGAQIPFDGELPSGQMAMKFFQMFNQFCQSQTQASTD